MLGADRKEVPPGTGTGQVATDECRPSSPLPPALPLPAVPWTVALTSLAPGCHFVLYHPVCLCPTRGRRGWWGLRGPERLVRQREMQRGGLGPRPQRPEPVSLSLPAVVSEDWLLPSLRVPALTQVGTPGCPGVAVAASSPPSASSPLNSERPSAVCSWTTDHSAESPPE